MKSKKLIRGLLWIVFPWLLMGCTARHQTTQSPVPTDNLLRPTATLRLLPPTATLSPTAAPTRKPPEVPGDTFWEDLRNRKYDLASSTSTIGPDGYIYSVYVLRRLTDVGFLAQDRGAGFCQLIVYRWDDDKYIRIYSTGDAYVNCQAIDWEATIRFYAGDIMPPDERTRTALSLKGYWSDINGNGLPEFAVVWEYCFNNCQPYESTYLRFYEIRDKATVVDLTKDFSGTIEPANMLNTAEPLTINVYEPVGYAYHQTVNTTWVYQWDGMKYVNVSSQHKDRYRSEVDNIVSLLEKRYGHALPTFDTSSFLTILAIYNGAQLPREEGLQTFLEVTQPDHYPGTESVMLCWLQVARAHAQMDYVQNQPFRIFPMDGIFIMGGGEGIDFFAYATVGIDTTEYEVSACK